MSLAGSFTGRLGGTSSQGGRLLPGYAGNQPSATVADSQGAALAGVGSPILATSASGSGVVAISGAGSNVTGG